MFAPWLPLLTTHGVGDNRDLKFKVYFEVFFSLWVDDLVSESVCP